MHSSCIAVKEKVQHKCPDAGKQVAVVMECARSSLPTKKMKTEDGKENGEKGIKSLENRECMKQSLKRQHKN